MGAWKNATPSAPVRGVVSARFHPGVDHADLAVRLGWYDQAHFINDFRTMLGNTPGEYAAAHGS